MRNLPIKAIPFVADGNDTPMRWHMSRRKRISQEKGSDPLTLASVRDGFGSWPIYQFEEAY